MTDFLCYRASNKNGDTHVEVRRWTKEEGWNDVHAFEGGFVIHGGADRRRVEKHLRRQWVGRILPSDHPVVKMAGDPWGDAGGQG